MAELALQLWSVRDELKEDYKAVLKKVSELGFQGVEFAGFYDVPAQEMKEVLEANGLKAAGSHTGYDKLVNELDEVIEYNKCIGNKNIVCPYYELKDEESLNTLIASFQPIAKKLKEAGLNFYYHNHAHEFVQLDGEYLLDRLYSAFPEDELKPEIDTYWVYNAGIEPTDYCRKYDGRCDLIHLKDGTKTEAKPVGAGEVDIKSILEVSKEINASWIIMEDESENPSGLESVTIGMKNLKEIMK